MSPIEKLEEFLKLYYPQYTVNDVVLSQTKGYLKTTKLCSEKTCIACRLLGGRVFHTISIKNAHPSRDEKGRFISPYKLWQELHGFIPEENEEDTEGISNENIPYEQFL